MREAAKVQTPGAHRPLAYKDRDAIKWCVSQKEWRYTQVAYR